MPEKMLDPTTTATHLNENALAATRIFETEANNLALHVVRALEAGDKNQTELLKGFMEFIKGNNKPTQKTALSNSAKLVKTTLDKIADSASTYSGVARQYKHSIDRALQTTQKN